MDKESHEDSNQFHIQQKQWQLVGVDVICHVTKLIMPQRICCTNYVEWPIGYRSKQSQNVQKEILIQLRTN